MVDENYGLMEPTDSESIDFVSDGYATGDVNDDDGQAIDSYLEAPDTRIDTRTMQDIAVPAETLPVPQRIISSTGFIGPGDKAMILNADMKRSGYTLLVHTTGVNRCFYFLSSEPNEFVAIISAQGSDNYGLKAEDSTDRPIEPNFIPYNGPLWVKANPNNNSPIYYICTSYTE